jgi:uncharacterized RDD family membrane protein YckC
MNELNRLMPGAAEIAGFWRRLLAFLIDGLLLGALGGTMGLIAFSRLAELGDWGRAVGFAIALVYFGLMDSKLSGGQTFGKQIVSIKVVTVNGSPLSIGPSMLRAAIFCVPYFLNTAFFHPSATVMWLVSFLVFGLGLSIAYLLVFNRRTRQSLHDLAVGAYVVRDEARGTVDAADRIWPVHLGVVGLILTAALVLPYLAQRLASSPVFARLVSIQQELEKEPGVRHAAVFSGVGRRFGANQSTRHTLSARLVFATPVVSADSVADRTFQIISNGDPSADKEDIVAITLVYGYDIGIASAWRGRTFAYSPEQWRQRISVPATRP